MKTSPRLIVEYHALPELMTVQQIAAVVGVSVSSIYRMVRENKITYERPSRRMILIPREETERLLRRGQEPHA